ncbi:hypothetical protein DH2020_042963 [Rehmannia glutinosa]|uniref:ABC transporter domain-containing protein n=1 Tax=Rehmannia glutinosa TaxID=99300 RepID=A0ABR0ULW4_REHGL
MEQAFNCPITHPSEWPPLLQIPAQPYRAVRTDSISYGDLPDDSCKRTGSCPVTMLITGNNQTFGQSVAGKMFASPLNTDISDILYSVAHDALGSKQRLALPILSMKLFFSNPISFLQPRCRPNSEFSVPLELGSAILPQEVRCVQGLHLWRNSSLEINDELYKGYRKGNSQEKINEIVAAYDFMNSNENLFSVSIWYNSTYKHDTGEGPISLTRVPRSVNLASNAYLEYLLGPTTKMLFEFVKEMPKPETRVRMDLSSLLGPLFFTWVIIQLFPVVLISLVYEKQHRLRIMMKMHGLGDGPYWMISYAYFLAISSIYMLCFVVFGSFVGLNFFNLNDYSIQFVFYFLYINLQISLAFLVADLFSNVKTATGAAIIFMELYPGFSLYRGLYEFSEYAFTGNYMGTDGMRWKDLTDSNNGMTEVLIIMAVEWVVVLGVAYYADQVRSSGKDPLFFLRRPQKGLSSSSRKPSLQRTGLKCVFKWRNSTLSKRDGNPEKFAVRDLSLALPQGECFGMLGPNGAGKTSFINMMTGLIKPSSGTAYVQGLDIRTDMDRIYTSMGVCPQHDLLWENLTGREHLLFYGRLKNLKGSSLTQAVEESLKSVNLFNGGVADKQAGKYSGGMKRRLSVAISLIGDPKVVYMDEPSTGLDPASRNLLWNVVKRAKQNRAIILTTHSMEEAEHLCDRLGIFVDGSLQCVGNPKELKARYGGSYVFTMTTSENHEQEVENLVHHLSPNATKIYQISGTQKFELPKHEIRIADVFQAVENAKSRFSVQAWGLADTTLEDVFIKVARGARAFTKLS